MANSTTVNTATAATQYTGHIFPSNKGIQKAYGSLILYTKGGEPVSVNISILTGQYGNFISYPHYQKKDGKRQDEVIPLTKNARAELLQEAETMYQAALAAQGQAQPQAQAAYQATPAPQAPVYQQPAQAAPVYQAPAAAPVQPAPVQQAVPQQPQTAAPAQSAQPQPVASAPVADSSNPFAGWEM